MFIKLLRISFGILFITFPFIKTQAQERELSKDVFIAAKIPDSLKENANSVIRYSYTELNVKISGRRTVKHHRIVTVLNEKGDREADFFLPYNRKFDNLSSIEMRVYNAAGDQIKKYHKGDMYDGAASDDETLVTDDRFLAVRHTIANYPSTVETVYEEDISSSLDLGSWDIQNDEQAVQNSIYQVDIDQNAGFRYLEKNISVKPQSSVINGSAIYSWKVSNLKAIKLEENAEYWRVFPRIDFASKSFSFYGLNGDMSSWQSFGQFIKALNADVCTLTPQREAEIRKMTDTIKSDKGKARFLYNYMQQNMRYVSIQLGIGGLKPFAANFVDQKKYGDCKALSNYMSALLRAVNIPSYYAIVNADANQEPADAKFPFDYFNHVILCVPFKNDTTWLECTSKTNQFGKLGPFTENRRALLITENGGRLVNTPRSLFADNTFNSDVHITLDAEGGAKAQVKILSTGGYRDSYIGLAALKMDDQKEAIIRTLKMKQASEFNLTHAADLNGTKELDFDLNYDRFCDVKAGDKQFLRPHVFELVGFTVPVEEKRKSDYYFEHPLQKTCTTVIDLPTGYEVETLPANQVLKFSYGNYDLSFAYDAAKNQVISKAKFNLVNQVIPAAKYNELQQYLDAVVKAQNKKLVIKRKA